MTTAQYLFVLPWYFLTLAWHRWRHQGVRMRPTGYCLHCDVIRFDTLMAKVERENERLFGWGPR